MKKEKPITFTPDNVVGILSYAYALGLIPYNKAFKNRCPKITTRRICKPQPIVVTDKYDFKQYSIPGKPKPGYSWDHPLYRGGDVLWVREPWRAPKKFDDLKPSQMNPDKWLKKNGGLWYLSDDRSPETPIDQPGRYRHARFMPKWAARIYLTVNKDSHVQSLTDMTPVEAINEGYPGLTNQHKVTEYVKWFKALWEEIHGAGSWNNDLYVWVTTFMVEKVINHAYDKN